MPVVPNENFFSNGGGSGGGGGASNLAAVLAVGASTGANDISVDTGQKISCAGDLTLGARGSTVTLNEAGHTSLVGFTATSIIRALNELNTSKQGSLGTLSKTGDLFRDITGVTATSDVEVNDEDAASFVDATTSGLRVSFEIPTNYAVTGNVQVFLRLSASTSVAANFRIDVDHRRNGGALVGAVQTTVTPSATANTQNLVGPILSLPTAGIAASDNLVLRVKRLGADGADTHTGAMRLFSVVLRYAV